MFMLFGVRLEVYAMDFSKQLYRQTANRA